MLLSRPNDKPRPHPLFLQSKPKWTFFYDVWFIIAPIGHNHLRLIVDKLISDFPYLKDKVPSNKIGRGVGTTQMEKTLVPYKYKMEVTSHQDLISIIYIFIYFCFCFLFLSSTFYVYVVCCVCRYNQIDKHLQDWAMQCIINRELKFGRLLCYVKKTFAYEKTKV